MPQPSATADGDDAVTRHEGSDGPSPAPDAPGDHPFRIGRYTILRRLGRGGMGVVYAAYDDKLDRKIALKLVYVSRERGTIGQARLLREAQALARLSHPNVVQVYEVGEHDRQVFLAMEFVSGVTLRAWARAERRPWREVLAIYHQAGRGLAAAHAVGLVHRDFKPESGLSSQVAENTSVPRLRGLDVPSMYQASGSRQDRAARDRRHRSHAKPSGGGARSKIPTL